MFNFLDLQCPRVLPASRLQTLLSCLATGNLGMSQYAAVLVASSSLDDDNIENFASQKAVSYVLTWIIQVNSSSCSYKLSFEAILFISGFQFSWLMSLELNFKSSVYSLILVGVNSFLWCIYLCTNLFTLGI